MTGAPSRRPDRPVRPRDCALAIGLPITLKELARQWQDRAYEFARSQVGAAASTNDPAQAWERMYRAFVDRLTAAVATIGVGLPSHLDARLGCVVWNARLEDVSDLLRRFHVVSIVAHSPFHLLTEDHVPGIAEVWRALRATPRKDDHEVLRALREDAGVMECRTTAELFRAINRRIVEARESYHCLKPASRAPGSGEAPAITLLSLHRAFPQWFTPPFVIELADGMHDFATLVRAVPENFRGNLQFLTCSGAYFTQALRTCRPLAEDYPSPHQVAWFLRRMPIYQTGIELLACQAMAYRDAVTRAHQMAARCLNDDDNEQRTDQ